MADQERYQERIDFGAPKLKPRAAAPLPPQLARELAAELSLQRPLAVLDLESTGLDPGVDRIVEISVRCIAADGGVASLDTLVFPGASIPAGSSVVHGIHDADVEGAPAFGDIAARVARLLRGADLAGYNLLWFDLPLLRAELDRAGIPFEWQQRAVIDACGIFKRRERRDLTAAYRFYVGGARPTAHSAAGDVLATVEVLAGQLRHYRDLPRNVEDLDALVRTERSPRS